MKKIIGAIILCMLMATLPLTTVAQENTVLETPERELERQLETILEHEVTEEEFKTFMEVRGTLQEKLKRLSKDGEWYPGEFYLGCLVIICEFIVLPIQLLFGRNLSLEVWWLCCVLIFLILGFPLVIAFGATFVWDEILGPDTPHSNMVDMIYNLLADWGWIFGLIPALIVAVFLLIYDVCAFLFLTIPFGLILCFEIMQEELAWIEYSYWPI
jgi:hypothetical protein